MSQNATVRRLLAVLASGLTFSAWLALTYAAGFGLHTLSGYATAWTLSALLAVCVAFLAGFYLGTFRGGVAFARGQVVEIFARLRGDGAALTLKNANGTIGVTLAPEDAANMARLLSRLGSSASFAAALDRAGAESKPLRDHLVDLRDNYRLLSVYADGLVDATAADDAALAADYGRQVEARALICGRAVLAAYQAGAFASASTHQVKGKA